RGSIRTAPIVVGNHSVPSRDFQPAGCEVPLHSLLFIPSAFPKAVDVMLEIVPAAKSLSCFLLTRKIPLLQLIHRFASSSSRIWKILLSKSPICVVYVVNFPFFQRERPANVLIQSTPSESS